MKPTLDTRSRVVCLTALLAFLPAAASAQEPQKPVSPPAEKKSSLDEVVELSPFVVSTDSEEGYYTPSAVSASRTRTDLIDLPFNLTVFNENFIRDIGARELSDIVNFASGVSGGVATSASDAGNGDTLGIVIRGQGSFVPNRNGFRRLRAVDSVTISRVEVLKGPSSVLYGQASPGGSVNYITKRPEQRNMFSTNVTVASYDFYKAAADVNVTTPAKNLAVRIVGSYEDSQSWMARYQQKQSVLYPSITWWIKPTTTLTLEYESDKKQLNPQTPLPFAALMNQETQLPAPVGLSWNSSGAHDYFDTEMGVFTAELIHKFNDNLTVRANFTKSTWEEDARTNRPSVVIPVGAGLPPTNPVTMGGRAPNKFTRGSWDQYVQVELLNNFTVGSVAVQNLLGYQRGEEEFIQDYSSLNPARDTVFWNLTDPSTWILSERFEDTLGIGGNTGLHAKNDLNSAYLTNQLTMLGGKLHTLAGVRYDKISSDTWNARTNLPNPHTPFDFDGKYSPQIGAIYQLDNGVAVFANYSTSIVNLYATAARHSDGTPFVPVPGSGEGYDIGLKSDILKGKLTGTLSFYSLEEKDIVRILPNVTIGGETFAPREQSGVNHSHGVELDLQARPTKDLQVGAAYAYTNAYVKSDPQTNLIVNGVRMLTREGHQLPYVPENQITVYATQQLGAMGPFQKTYVTANARWLDHRQYKDDWDLVAAPVGGVQTLQAPYMLDSYTDVTVGVGGVFQVGKVKCTVSLLVKNAFDERYFRIREYYAAPRQFEFSLGARF